jgi:sugar O-acyltransferase (sialic acid O-acetyltransferase NeuD family)
MKKSLILVGGGGHCKACIDVVEQGRRFDIAGIVDVPEMLHQKILNSKIIAKDDDLPRLVKEYENFLITLGQIKSPAKRIRISQTLKELGAKLPVIISPLAYVSEHAEIGDGTIIMHYALVNAGVRIGRNCIINTKALIEHDATIGDHCHIATGAIINGGVKVGSGTFFGSNAVCREDIEIGENAVIGCGTKIIKNIPPDSLTFEP